MTHRWAVAACLGLVLASVPARALVGKGDRVADFSIEDPEGKAVRLSSFGHRTILVMYEDRVAIEWNAALKKRLSKDRSLPRTLVVVPVADMRRWKFWPARNFAQKELKKRSKEMGRTLYGDWNGEAAKVLGVTEKSSSIVLVGPDGQVSWAASGRLTGERIDDLVALIRGAGDDGRPATPKEAPDGREPVAKDGKALEAPDATRKEMPDAKAPPAKDGKAVPAPDAQVPPPAAAVEPERPADPAPEAAAGSDPAPAPPPPEPAR